jgi:hypothetical protein
MTFKCENHKFQCDSITEWDNHSEEKEHTITGISPCSLCGFSTEFSFTGKKKSGTIPCVCEECKEGLR